VNSSREPPFRNPITGSAGCCASASNAQSIAGATAALPMSGMNSRRRIDRPFMGTYHYRLRCAAQQYCEVDFREGSMLSKNAVM